LSDLARNLGFGDVFGLSTFGRFASLFSLGLGLGLGRRGVGRLFLVLLLVIARVVGLFTLQRGREGREFEV
jgi:hypothetical protein